jgi:hypothetical protein
VQIQRNLQALLAGRPPVAFDLLLQRLFRRHFLGGFFFAASE